MTREEAIAIIEMWIQEHSRFAAQVVNATWDAQGLWVIEAECSEVVWRQTVSPTGEVSVPLLLN